MFRSALLLSLLLSAQVSAQLMISPTRVVFEDRQRTATVTVINASSKSQSYRIGWVEQIATEQGGYQKLTNEQLTQYPLASPLLRITPKQVRLKPNETQNIKLVLRRKQGLTDGDYRSHLQFKALPHQPTPKKSSGVDILTSFTIPVIYRLGDINYQIKVADIDANRQAMKTTVKVTLARTGKTGVIGSLKVLKQNADGTEEEIGVLNRVHFYPELSQVQQSISFDTNKLPKNGQVKLVYLGSEEFKGTVLAEQKFTIR